MDYNTLTIVFLLVFFVGIALGRYFTRSAILTKITEHIGNLNDILHNAKIELRTGNKISYDHLTQELEPTISEGGVVKEEAERMIKEYEDRIYEATHIRDLYV
ncbi:hypothetical protein ACQCN2_13365 [Brevibacillus ginsengisoli]|uniref:hypothetical protein n=1 Tax=Brevibacillus ginsengisoli TaxID=363854 RepID=UPI003CE9AA99